MKSHPTIIQGGMGIAVSSWKLAKEIALQGELGVISGTAIDSVMARRLQDGDPTGETRRALSHFPDAIVVQEILKRFFIEGGKDPKRPYIDVPKLIVKPTTFALHLLIASTFVEVWLAKEDHDGLVGMNILEKIQLAIPAQLYGAMLAGVDYILIGAGIPAQIPRLLNSLSLGNSITMKVDVEDTNDKYQIGFDPACIDGVHYPIKRPQFLAIVSSHALVSYLNKDAETKPDGFVIEYHVAGGHNAPPRAKNSTDANGEAVYSDADIPNLEKVIASGSPFWLAGGFGTPEKLIEAKALGAQGVQVGSIFALCNESGFTPELRSQVLSSLASGEARVVTDASASPTGFPFKVIELDATLSESDLFAERTRKCDLGYLRTPFKRESGGIGYRCPGEPLDTFVFKSGLAADAERSKCLCNALMADIGLGQIRVDGRPELPLITIGSDLEGSISLVNQYPDGWSAKQGLEYLRMAQ
jgi:NAD(P)H-dependent flavin oxidoreductase YrpB (nitropropane dioxygenase family)